MTNYVEYRYSTPCHSHPDIAARILSIIDNDPAGGIVCELGCGSGWICHRLAERGFITVGVDLSASGIKAANSTNIQNARFFHDAIDCNLSHRIDLANKCDIVLSNDVIEHLYRPADLLEAARGLLKPGGVMITATPYHGYMKNLAIAVLGRGDRHYDPLWDGGHVKFFSPATLTKLMVSNGFAVNNIEYVGRFYGFWKSMICSASLESVS